MAMRSLETDYLVVGAGAMGMAFTDALIDHADVHVTLVDRRHAAGGHWQDAYPFVQLHQASVFYGVASTVLGSGAVQQQRPGGGAPGTGPSVGDPGLLRRHPASPLRRLGPRHLPRRRASTTRDGSSHLVTSRVSGETVRGRRATPRRRRHLPVADDPRDDTPAVRCRRRRPRRRRSTSSPGWPTAPSSYVIVGSGKTATDGIVWLLANGVQPDRIVWVRPRDPWMLNRAVVQPDPVVALGLAADTMAAAADAESLDDLFLRLEAAGVMLRIDRDVIPTMAKTPTLGAWELDLLRTIEHVVRLGHIKHVTAPRDRPRRRGRSRWRRARSSCTAPPPDCSTRRWFPSGSRTRSGSRRSGPASRASTRRWPATWRRPATTTGSATGCVRPTPSPTTRPTGRGCRFVEPSRRARYGAEPDIAAWANGCALNPARIEPSQRDDPAVQAAAARLADVAERGLAGMAELARAAPHPGDEQQ